MSDDRRVIDFSDIQGIPTEALEKLNEMELDPYATRRAMFEPWQDELLLRLWKSSARQKDVAEVIGYSVGTCLTRWRELRGGDK